MTLHAACRSGFASTREACLQPLVFSLILLGRCLCSVQGVPTDAGTEVLSGPHLGGNVSPSVLRDWEFLLICDYSRSAIYCLPLVSERPWILRCSRAIFSVVRFYTLRHRMRRSRPSAEPTLPSWCALAMSMPPVLTWGQVCSSFLRGLGIPWGSGVIPKMGSCLRMLDKLPCDTSSELCFLCRESC